MGTQSPVGRATLIALGLLVVGQILSPGFASYGQVVNILRISALLGIIAAAQTLVIISGNEGIDLSVGVLVSLGAVMTAQITGAGATRCSPLRCWPWPLRGFS